MIYFYLSSLIIAVSLCFQSCVPLQQITTSKDYTWVKDSSNRFHYYFEKGIWSKDLADTIKFTSENSFEKIILKYQEDNFFPLKRMNIFIVDDIAKLNERFGESFYYLNFGSGLHRNDGYVDDTVGVISRNGNEPYIITTVSKFGANKNYDFVLALLIYQTLKSIGGYVFKSEFEYSIAMYAQDNWSGYDLHDLTAHFYQNQLTFPYVRWCINVFGQGSFRNAPIFRGNNYTLLEWVYNYRILYPMTASLYKYIGEKYGVLALQKWRFRDCPKVS